MLFPLVAIPAIAALAPSSEARRFDDYPETRIDHYTVTATTARELREEMRRRGPNNGGTHDVAARAYYTFDWSASSQGPKPCNATVTISTSVRFPLHTDPAALSPALRAEWTRFIRELERHEVGHVALAYAALPKLKEAIEQGPCPGAEARANRVDAELRRQQEAFDADPANRVLALRDLE